MKRRSLAIPLALLLGWASSVGAQSGLHGFLAVRGETIVAAENADQLFVPASVLKLVVSALALHHLGPEHRIVTELRADGEIRNGTLHDDLTLIAAADPTWSTRFFEDDPRAPIHDLAKQLRQRGIQRIEGDLVVDVSRFPGRSFPTSRPASESAYGYAAPTSALAIDESAVQIAIAPGARIGAAGSARIKSPTDSGLKLRNHISTVSKERHGVGTVDFLPVWESHTIVVRGEYPISEPPYVIPISAPSPSQFAGRQVLVSLRNAGIEVAGSLRIATRSTNAAKQLAHIRSPSLSERLEPILTDSHNWHAEMLLRSVAAEVTGEGRRDSGLELAESFLADVVGCPAGSFHLDDASGLSPYNLISPRAVVELLRFVDRQPWRKAFHDALARNGKGTLEAWRGLPSVAAKTGTIRNTLALAGVLDPGSSRPILFACFLGHRPEARAPQRREIGDLLRRWRR